MIKNEDHEGGEGPRREGRSDLLEHLTSLYSGKPKAVSVCIVITSPTAVALDEWSTSKLFQTGPGGCEGLARTFGTSAGVLQKKRTMGQQLIPTHRRQRAPRLPGRSQSAPFQKACSLPHAVTTEHTGAHPAQSLQAGCCSTHGARQDSPWHRNQATTPPKIGDASPASSELKEMLFSLLFLKH